jgi:hypothetical protein
MELILNSCERDEVGPAKPIVIDNSCDTNKVSYKQFIQPILDVKCKDCHNSSYDAGGVNLEGYDNIRKVAISGKLKSSLLGTMRSYINDDCNYSKIQAWINQGSNNN